MSPAFVEGWAHYTEELSLDLGFREGDPRFAAGVAIEGLVRVTRLAAAIGVHTGAMTVADAARGSSPTRSCRGGRRRSEADRATFDPTYGRYTWGKLVILETAGEGTRSSGAPATRTADSTKRCSTSARRHSACSARRSSAADCSRRQQQVDLQPLREVSELAHHLRCHRLREWHVLVDGVDTQHALFRSVVASTFPTRRSP